MKKKVSILACLLIIVPIPSVLGTTQSTGLMSNEGVVQQSVDTDVVDMINQVNRSLISYYLEGIVSFGYRKTGSDNCKSAAEYLYDQFRELGLFTYFDSWRYFRYNFRHKTLLVDKNVVAVHNGTDSSSDAVIIICAHYDTIGNSPGANDDGSGIALMLSIANITSQIGFNHTIRFVAFSGEEQGCFGSFYDAKQSYKRDENIIAVLNIDGIGFVNTSEDGKIVQMFAQERSKWIVDFANDIAEKYNKDIDLRAQYALQYPCDHESYNDYGYDGVQFVQPKPELFHWLHTPEDTIDKINFTYIVKITKLVLAMAIELANRPIDVQIRIITPYEGRMYVYDLPILRTPGFNLFRTRMRGLTYLFGKAIARVNIKTDKEINSVYFGIDGYKAYVCNEPPYEWRIGKNMYPQTFRLKGYHRLTVCVTTNAGNCAYDEMDMFIFTLS